MTTWEDHLLREEAWTPEEPEPAGKWWWEQLEHGGTSHISYAQRNLKNPEEHEGRAQLCKDCWNYKFAEYVAGSFHAPPKAKPKVKA